uniref:Uncharacterized protein n=1 Tax=Arion vulgaris TaxID=1028688 RepID=A0A0B7AIY9_9EUPU
MWLLRWNLEGKRIRRRPRETLRHTVDRERVGMTWNELNWLVQERSSWKYVNPSCFRV